MVQTNNTDDFASVDTIYKKREIRTHNYFKKYYAEHLSKMTRLEPISRQILLKQLLKRATLLGISDAGVISACNTVLEKVTLPILTLSNYSFLQSNHSLSNIMIDMALIIGLNTVITASGEQEQFTDASLAHAKDDYAVPPSISELSGNEVELVHQNRIEKLREKTIKNYFKSYGDSSVILESLARSDEKLEEFLIEHTDRMQNTTNFYNNYISILEKFEIFLLDVEYATLIKSPLSVSMQQYEQILKYLKQGLGVNVPSELKLFVIMSTIP